MKNLLVVLAFLIPTSAFGQLNLTNFEKKAIVDDSLDNVYFKKIIIQTIDDLNLEYIISNLKEGITTFDCYEAHKLKKSYLDKYNYVVLTELLAYECNYQVIYFNEKELYLKHTYSSQLEMIINYNFITDTYNVEVYNRHYKFKI